MHKAQEFLKFPKMRALTLDGKPLLFTIAGSRAKFPGSINITNGESYSSTESKFYGRIKKFGSLQSYKDAPPRFLGSLQLIETDPVAAAKVYGNATSNCCFCNRELTRPDSVAAGYGECCAGHYGMPYHKGNKKIEEELVIDGFFPISTEPMQLEFNLLKAGTR